MKNQYEDDQCSDENQIHLQIKASLGIKWTSFSMVYTTLIQFFNILILARLLNPKDYGLMGYVLIVIGFGSLFSDAGISGAIIHYQKNNQNQLSTLYWISFIIGLLLFIGAFLFAPFYSIFYNEPELIKLTRLSSIIFIIIPIGQQYQILLQKEMHFKHLSLIDIISTTSSVLISIFTAINGFGVMALILGQISYQSLKSILNFLIGIKIWKPSLVLKISEVISYLSFGGFQIGERMVDYFNSNIDKIIIGRFLGTIALGYYNIAFNLLLYPIQLINPIFTKVYFPYFSKIQSNIDLLKEKYLELIKTITFITFPIFIMLIPLSPALIPILYGEQWSQSIIIIQLLAIAGLSISQGNPIGSLLLAKGYAKQGFFWNLFLVPVYMIGLSLSANYFGLNGFAMGKTIITTMMFGFGYLYLIRRCLGNCFIEYIWNFTPFIVFSVIGAILISFISLNSLYYQLLLQLIVGGGFYLILVFIFDKKFVKNFITTYFKF